MLDRPNRCLTPRELAARWRTRPATIREMVRRGQLAAFKLGNGLRIAPEEVMRLERGPLAVRPARQQRREQIPPEVVRLLETCGRAAGMSFIPFIPAPANGDRRG